MKHSQVQTLFSKHSSFLSDPDGGISQAGNNSPQLPPVVIVPGVQNSRTEEGEKSKLRANLWIPLQLNNRVHHARVWPSMGRGGLRKDKMDPSPYSRAGLMGNHTKVKMIVTYLIFFLIYKSCMYHQSEKLINPWLVDGQTNPPNLFLS